MSSNKMWSPGDLLLISTWVQSEDRDVLKPALVIAVNNTGWGTLGQKWDGMILQENRLVWIHDAWRKRWSIIEAKCDGISFT